MQSVKEEPVYVPEKKFIKRFSIKAKFINPFEVKENSCKRTESLLIGNFGNVAPVFKTIDTKLADQLVSLAGKIFESRISKEIGNYFEYTLLITDLRHDFYKPLILHLKLI